MDDPNEPNARFEYPERELAKLSGSRDAWRLFALFQAFWITLFLVTQCVHVAAADRTGSSALP